MATSTFDRKIVISDPTKLLDLLNSKTPVQKITKPSEKEVERSERVLKQLCSHLKA